MHSKAHPFVDLQTALDSAEAGLPAHASAAQSYLSTYSFNPAHQAQMWRIHVAGYRVFVHHRQSSEPSAQATMRRTILLVHGYLEHTGLLSQTTHWLVELGYRASLLKQC